MANSKVNESTSHLLTEKNQETRMSMENIDAVLNDFDKIKSDRLDASPGGVDREERADRQESYAHINSNDSNGQASNMLLNSMLDPNKDRAPSTEAGMSQSAPSEKTKEKLAKKRKVSRVVAEKLNETGGPQISVAFGKSTIARRVREAYKQEMKRRSYLLYGNINMEEHMYQIKKERMVN